MPPARRSAEDWWRTRGVGDGVTHIWEPWIKTYYRCNVWHVRGRDRDMLVDSGMGVVSLRANIPLVTERPLTAVASHTHFDHIGCHHEFADRVIHRAEADLLAHPTRANTFADKYVTDAIFDALPPAPYAAETYAVRGAPASRIVEDGDVVDLGDRRFEVIHTPGHSPGGIALWEAATGVLFSGDIHYDGPLSEPDNEREMAEYEGSMRRLLALPVRVVHGGHYPSFGRERHRKLVTDWLAKRENP